MTIRKKTSKKNLMPIVTILSIIISIIIWWQVINRWIDFLYWPSIPMVIRALINIRRNILLGMWASSYRAILGYALGCSLGIIIGCVMSWNKWINAFITPYIEILRPIPAIAFIPFFILWFGIGELGKILMVGWGTSVIMVITTLEGIHQLNKVYIRAASILGASKWEIYKTIIFPGSLPAIMGGLRVNAAFSFGLVIVAEFLGAPSGLGFLIIFARRTMNTEVMLLSVMIIGLLAFLFDKFVLLIGRYLTRWMT